MVSLFRSSTLIGAIVDSFPTNEFPNFSYLFLFTKKGEGNSNVVINHQKLW